MSHHRHGHQTQHFGPRADLTPIKQFVRETDEQLATRLQLKADKIVKDIKALWNPRMVMEQAEWDKQAEAAGPQFIKNAMGYIQKLKEKQE